MNVPLLTVREVAAWLRLSPSKIYALAQSGKLPCVRIDASLRFDSAAVREYLESCAQPARTEGAA